MANTSYEQLNFIADCIDEVRNKYMYVLSRNVKMIYILWMMSKTMYPGVTFISVKACEWGLGTGPVLLIIPARNFRVLNKKGFFSSQNIGETAFNSGFHYNSDSEKITSNQNPKLKVISTLLKSG